MDKGSLDLEGTKTDSSMASLQKHPFVSFIFKSVWYRCIEKSSLKILQNISF